MEIYFLKWHHMDVVVPPKSIFGPKIILAQCEPSKFKGCAKISENYTQLQTEIFAVTREILNTGYNFHEKGGPYYNFKQ